MGRLDQWRDFPFIILDGGLASELEKNGYVLDNLLWSASVLAESPGAVSEIHTAYLNAGADIITTASYQATIPGLMKGGYSFGEAGEIISSSVKIARESVSLFMDSENYDFSMPLPLVAGSAGSYGAYLADGSEYRGDFTLSSGEYKEFHRGRLEILIESGADIIAFETVPSYDEALAIADLMDEYGDVEYWISFTARDGKSISCGRLFADCLEFLKGRKNLAAAGINCSDPSLFTSLLESGRGFAEKPFIVYPNSGEMYSTSDHHWHGDSRASSLGAYAREWNLLGAGIIGGCCRTGPADTSTLVSVRKAMMEGKAL